MNLKIIQLTDELVNIMVIFLDLVLILINIIVSIIIQLHIIQQFSQPYCIFIFFISFTINPFIITILLLIFLLFFIFSDLEYLPSFFFKLLFLDLLDFFLQCLLILILFHPFLLLFFDSFGILTQKTIITLYKLTFFLVIGSLSISIIRSSISFYYFSFKSTFPFSCSALILFSLYNLFFLLGFFCLITNTTSLLNLLSFNKLSLVKSKPSTILPYLKTSPR